MIVQFAIREEEINRPHNNQSESGITPTPISAWKMMLTHAERLLIQLERKKKGKNDESNEKL